jgi:hypothetical protein
VLPVSNYTDVTDRYRDKGRGIAEGVGKMNESVTGCGHQGPSGMTFPDILADPLVRAVMVADRVDPDALRADLVRIAWGLRSREKPRALDTMAC